MARRKAQPPSSNYEEEDEFEDEYDEEFEATVDDFVHGVMTHPKTSRLFGKLGLTLDRIGQGLDMLGQVINRQAGPRYGHATGNIPHTPPPPPRQPPPQRRPIDPFVILGLPRDQPITPEMVRERRKQLAFIYHGDRGGNEESMKLVNAAADALLAKLGAR